jgi:hypothetical protein
MGSIPYRMYDVCKKKLGVRWGLVDKISPAFELRNSGAPAVAMPACRVPAGLVALGLFTLCGQSLRRIPPPALAGDGSTVVLCHPLCAAHSSVLSSRASLHFASAPLAYLWVAPPGQSPGPNLAPVDARCGPTRPNPAGDLMRIMPPSGHTPPRVGGGRGGGEGGSGGQGRVQGRQHSDVSTARLPVSTRTLRGCLIA